MSISATAIRSTFESLINVAPNKLTFTIDSENYAGIKTVLKKEVQYTAYGLDSDYSFSVIASLNDLPSSPAIDTEVTISGTIYRLLGSETDSTDISIRLDLGPRYS